MAQFDQNAEVVAAGGLVMLVSFPFYRIYAFIEVFAGVCRGIGKAKEATLITLLCFAAMRLTLLLLVQRKLSRGRIRPTGAAEHGRICLAEAAARQDSPSGSRRAWQDSSNGSPRGGVGRQDSFAMHDLRGLDGRRGT